MSRNLDVVPVFQMVQAIAAERAAERAAVVRWLRERALVAPNERSCLLQEALANSIERGEHRREEE